MPARPVGVSTARRPFAWPTVVDRRAGSTRPCWPGPAETRDSAARAGVSGTCQRVPPADPPADRAWAEGAREPEPSPAPGTVRPRSVGGYRPGPARRVVPGIGCGNRRPSDRPAGRSAVRGGCRRGAVWTAGGRAAIAAFEPWAGADRQPGVTREPRIGPRPGAQPEGGAAVRPDQPAVDAGGAEARVRGVRHGAARPG